jgi:undecaprenyl-diphosphatase
MGWAVFVGTIPIGILGFALHKQIETSFRSLYIIAATLILFGGVMLLAERFGKHNRKVEGVDVKDGLWVGLWQCLALIPGVSRSGSTISGALFLGFDRVAAARFSFLLSLPSVTLAGLYEAYKSVKEKDPLHPIHWTPVLVATVVSFIVGYAAIKYFIRFLQKRGIAPFVWYRVALGILILVLVQAGYLAPNAGATETAPETVAMSTR